MTPTYEIKDTKYMSERGMRTSSIERARKMKAESYPLGRFIIIDRATKKEVV